MKKLIFLMILTAQAQAEVCQQFRSKGRFENLADHNHDKSKF